MSRRDKQGRRRQEASAAHHKYGFRAYFVAQLFRWLGIVVRCAMAVGITYLAADAWVRRAALLAGKTTTANIVENLSVSTNLLDKVTDKLADEWVAAGLSAVTFIVMFVLNRQQRKRYHDMIEQLAPFREKYERLLDQRRSSSRLTSRGETPED